MNISAVSDKPYNTSPAGGTDPAMSTLEEEKKKLKEEIEELEEKATNHSSKTADAKLKVLQTKLTLIEMKISQAKAQQQKQGPQHRSATPYAGTGISEDCVDLFA